jgi:4-hydroxymandelate oxidase
VTSDLHPILAPTDLDLTDLEALAFSVLDPAARDFFSGGADDERTLADNSAAWRRARLRPRVLRDVGVLDMATTLLGAPVAAPIAVAPMGLQRLAHPDGEAAMVRGAAAAGVLHVASTMATTSLEDVAAAAPHGLRWFQLYVHRDRGFTRALVDRAAEAGYAAVVLTVDVPVLGRRRRDERNGFALPPHLRLANLDVGVVADGRGSGLTAYTAEAFDPTVTVADLERLVADSPLPVVVKGVLRGDDAGACVDAGAAAVAVSNHGGRQLDGAVATADALPDVVSAVGDRVEVYVDGGIRRGTDVVVALAAGARAVLVGRPLLYALAVGGAEGVAGALGDLHDELRRAMALCGAARPDDMTEDLLA